MKVSVLVLHLVLVLGVGLLEHGVHLRVRLLLSCEHRQPGFLVRLLLEEVVTFVSPAFAPTHDLRRRLRQRLHAIPRVIPKKSLLRVRQRPLRGRLRLLSTRVLVRICPVLGPEAYC